MFAKHSLFLLLTLLPLLSHAHDLPENTKLVPLDVLSFPQNIPKDYKEPWFLMLYAPWCGHCKSAMPHFSELASKLDGQVKVGVINCDDSRPICTHFGIRGFPSFFFMKDGQTYKYTGPRDVGGWAKFAEEGYKKAIPEDIPPYSSMPGDRPKKALVRLNDNNFKQYIPTVDHEPWLVMFYAPWCSHCQESFPVFEQFANERQGKVNVAAINGDDNSQSRARFTIASYPAFLYIKDGLKYSYEGEASIEGFDKFVQGGYLKVNGVKIPAEPNTMNNLWMEFLMVASEVQLIVREHKAACIGLLVLLVGLTYFAVQMIEVPEASSPSKVQQEKKEDEVKDKTVEKKEGGEEKKEKKKEKHADEKKKEKPAGQKKRD